LIFKNALVVDDDPVQVEIVRNVLQMIDITNVSVAKDGLEAIQILAAEDQPFDLIISDMQMPNIDGLELLESLRQHKKHSDTVFVLMTWDNTLKAPIKAKEKGATIFLKKPFDPQRLKDSLAMLTS